MMMMMMMRMIIYETCIRGVDVCVVVKGCARMCRDRWGI